MSNDIVDNPAIDVDGYLLQGDDWNQSVAFELAAAAGIRQLTDDHWKVISALRDQYSEGEPDLFPRVPWTCADVGFGEDCIVELFGDASVAWRIAGLPKAGIDMAAYMPGSNLV
ncbi:MAG: TusE/DsrC/DsvC family sulfur relay protein [Gammaproteobacteria bacterium]|nr:TusE/DsrC/DsvC family sulfur relay protein [Gammaproteobacteria bacterium]